MAQLLLDFEQRFYEASRQLQESKRAQEEERQKLLVAERAQAKVEEKSRNTSLPEFLDACHVHHQSGLTVQTDTTLWTTGDPANANYKMRLERILAWDDFPTRQEAIWNDFQ